MSPDGLFTVTTPLATVHFAGDPSLSDTHASRFLPSKSTTASDGASASTRPGVITTGTGVQTSVSAGLAVDLGGGVCALDVVTMTDVVRTTTTHSGNRRM